MVKQILGIGDQHVVGKLADVIAILGIHFMDKGLEQVLCHLALAVIHLVFDMVQLLQQAVADPVIVN